MRAHSWSLCIVLGAVVACKRPSPPAETVVVPKEAPEPPPPPPVNIDEATVTVRASGGVGLGVVIHPGFVLTSARLLGSSAEGIAVEFLGAVPEPMQVAMESRPLDLAVLKCGPTAKRCLASRPPPLGASSSVGLQAPMLAYRRTKGSNRTLQRGRLFERVHHQGIVYLSTDLEVSSNDIGGPLFDKHLHLIGIQLGETPDGHRGLGMVVERALQEILPVVPGLKSPPFDPAFIKLQRRARTIAVPPSPTQPTRPQTKPDWLRPSADIEVREATTGRSKGSDRGRTTYFMETRFLLRVRSMKFSEFVSKPVKLLTVNSANQNIRQEEQLPKPELLGSTLTNGETTLSVLIRHTSKSGFLNVTGEKVIKLGSAHSKVFKVENRE